MFGQKDTGLLHEDKTCNHIWVNHIFASSTVRTLVCWTTGIKQGTWGPYLAPDSNIFPHQLQKEVLSLYFDCCLRLSEVYPLQQYAIVCLQDEHRNSFWVKPRADSHRNSHRLQSSVSLADNLRVHKTGAAYVSNNLPWISERVKRNMWRGGRGLIL